MDKPVDVLAVMEECGAYVDDAAQFPEQFKAGVVKRHQREYAAARAAVAELIEAARDVTGELTRDPEAGTPLARLDAALTRCGAI